jgi:hypothetical protein
VSAVLEWQALEPTTDLLCVIVFHCSATVQLPWSWQLLQLRAMLEGPCIG